VDEDLQGAPDDRVVSLRRYPPGDLDAMWSESRSRYERDLRENGGLDSAQARSKAERDTAWLRGLNTLVLEIEHEGTRAGRVVLWLDAFEERGQAWLFELVVDEPLRGRGLGREALRLAEEEARSRGMRRMALNVLGGNDVARSLYRTAGYAEASVHMTRAL
jgi:GNAT superfamily N-acetyltransferase